MTDEIYDRDPLDVAAYETVHNYVNKVTGKKGALGLAPAIGMPPSTLQNKVNPNEDFAQLGLKEARRVMLTTGNKLILHTLAHELGEACIELPMLNFPADMDLMQAWMDWEEEHAESIKKIKSILSDGKVTHSELAELQVEFFEDLEKGMKLFSELKSMAEPDEKVTPIGRAKG